MIQILTPEEIRAEIRAVVREEVRAAQAATATPALLTVAEAANLVGVHPRTIRRRIKGRELLPVYVGRCVKIDRDQLIPPGRLVERLARAA